MLDQNLRVINTTNITKIVKIAPRASISITIDILSSFGLHLFISCLNGISNNIYFAVHLRSWLLSALHPVKYTSNISLTINDLNNSGLFQVKKQSYVFLSKKTKLCFFGFDQMFSIPFLNVTAIPISLTSQTFKLDGLEVA